MQSLWILLENGHNAYFRHYNKPAAEGKSTKKTYQLWTYGNVRYSFMGIPIRTKLFYMVTTQLHNHYTNLLLKYMDLYRDICYFELAQTLIV